MGYSCEHLGNMSSCVISVLRMWAIGLHRQADSLFRKVQSAWKTRRATDSRRVVHCRRYSRLESWSGGQMKKSLSPSLGHAVCLIWEEVSKKQKQKQKTNCLRPVLWEIWKEHGQIWTDTCLREKSVSTVWSGEIAEFLILLLLVLQSWVSSAVPSPSEVQSSDWSLVRRQGGSHSKNLLHIGP